MILCKTGLIANLARPESNVTGFTNVTAELAGKRLELLKEAFPKIYRVGHLWSGLTGAARLSRNRDSCPCLADTASTSGNEGAWRIWRMPSESGAKIQMV